MTVVWHADPEILEAYTEDRLDPAGAASVEAHLLACEQCRAECAAAVDDGELASIWEHVADAVDSARVPWSVRALQGIGLRESTARLVAATPALRVSWLVAVAIAVGFAVFAAYRSNGDPTIFLWLAPLVPLAGVAAAYGPGVDPMYEIGAATPTHGLRLLLLRAAAVAGVAALLLVPATLALPDLALIDVAWLLPALAVSTATLALATFIGPIKAGIVVGACWLVLVPISVLLAEHDRHVVAEQLFLFRPAAQFVCVAVAVAASIVLFTRRRALGVVASR
jgi:hypothetical protein